jgi:hypothetical protein
MKNISVILFSIITSFSLMSQTFNKNYFDTDANDSFVSIYLSIDNLMISKSNSNLTNLDSLYSSKHIMSKNGLEYFAFRITANTIYYDTKNKSLVGNFISYYNDGDTLHISMSEKNGDVIFLNIFNHNNKMSVIITENMINGKTKVYFSDSCFLERKSRG